MESIGKRAYNFKVHVRTLDLMEAERTVYGSNSALIMIIVIWNVGMEQEKTVDERSFEG